MKISAMLERFELNSKSLLQFGIKFKFYYDKKILRFLHFCSVDKNINKDRSSIFTKLKRTAARKQVRLEKKESNKQKKLENKPIYLQKREHLRLRERETIEYVRAMSIKYHGKMIKTTESTYCFDAELGILKDGKFIEDLKTCYKVFKHFEKMEQVA